MELAEKEKLSDRVTMAIMEMITIKKRYKPGDKLPNENLLSEELGVSRTTLREAVNNLVVQNVLCKQRGKGTFVVDNTGLTDDLGIDELNYMRVRLSDLYELRMMIEPQIAAIAAKKATDDEIDLITRLAEKIEDYTLSSKDVIEYNRRFHDEIAKATHNEFVIRLINNINTAVVKEFDVQEEEQINNDDMVKSHKLLVDYMRLRDSEGARQAMRLHLMYSVKDFNRGGL